MPHFPVPIPVDRYKRGKERFWNLRNETGSLFGSSVGELSEDDILEPRTKYFEIVQFSENDASTASEDELLSSSDDDEDWNSVDTEDGDESSSLDVKSTASSKDSYEADSEIKPNSVNVQEDQSDDSCILSSTLTITLGKDQLTSHSELLRRKTEAAEPVEKQVVVLDNQPLDITQSTVLSTSTSDYHNTIKGMHYWEIRKIMKFLQSSDESGTTLALMRLLDCDLDDVVNHAAIEDTGAIETLLNLMNVKSAMCRIYALEVLDKLTEASDKMVEDCIDLGFTQDVHTILRSPDDQEVLIAVKCLLNLITTRRSRTVIRKAGLIPILFSLVHRVPESLLQQRLSDVLDDVQHRRLEIALGSLYALTTLSRSPKVRSDLLEDGSLSIIKVLLKSKERLVVRAALENLVLWSSVKKYRLEFQYKELIQLAMAEWTRHREIVCHFFYKMAIGEVGREQILKSEALHAIMDYLNSGLVTENPKCFKYALACIHRVHVCGILSQLSISPENWPVFIASGALASMMSLIFTTATDSHLLAECLKVLSDVAHCPEGVDFLTARYSELLPYLMSLLKEDDPLLIKCAARALAPLTRTNKELTESMTDDGECFEVLFDLLGHNDEALSTAVCDVLTSITVHASVLPVYRESGIVYNFVPLFASANESLQESVSALTAECADDTTMSREIGKLGIIQRLIQFLKSPNTHVVIAAVNALSRLSTTPHNGACAIKAGISSILLEMGSSPYTELREAAMDCAANLRNMALSVEKSVIWRPRTSRKTRHRRKALRYFKPVIHFHENIEICHLKREPTEKMTKRNS
ncbi:ARM [Nesidiocoris tenuis]|uniref:ARM n=1 Tax=Nesidiocoris tenuis TaxID=355587 RepID=A0ABN7B7G0_9HEMI|nr:ARM [Nesidiocoris tenuis]